MQEKMRRLLSALLMLALLMGGVPVSAEGISAEEQALEIIMDPMMDFDPEPETEISADMLPAEPVAEPSAAPTVEPTVEPTTEPAAEPEAEGEELGELTIVTMAATVDTEDGQIVEMEEEELPQETIIELPDEFEETPASSFKYSIKNGKCTITDFRGKETEIIVPAYIKETPVTAIAKNAFRDCKKVTSIRIQEGVVSIGSAAFRNCKELTQLIVPASVTSIASDAFKYCKKHMLVVDKNSWAYNWCLQNGTPYALTGRIIDGPTKIYLNAEEITLGVKEKFTLAAMDNLGATEGLTFSSGSAKVASVDANGVVTAKRAGKTTITVRAANYVNAECAVIVKKAPSKITLSEKSLTLYLGQSLPLSWTLSAKSTGSVSFSSDSDCVSVDAGGMLTAQAIGEAKVTAKTYNGKKAVCTVKVVGVPSFVSLPETYISLPMLMTARLNPVIDEGCGTSFSYISSDEEIAVVDADGVITGVNAGFAVITATTHNGFSADCVVEVTLAPTRIDMTGEITLGVKEKFTLSPVDNLGGTEGFTFKSSSAKIASVDANGVITAKKAGKATITASTFNGASAECLVDVKSAPKSIKLNQSKATLFVGESLQLTYKLSSKSAGTVTFSSDSDCVSVDANGMVTAMNEGTAKVTAKTFNGKKAVCTFKVKSSNYAITSMRAEAQHIYATVSTKSACTLYVEVRSQDGKKVLHKASAPAGEDLQMQEIAAAGMASYPEYYQLRGVLKDAKGEELCNTYISKRYTEAYVEFEQQSPADFDQDRVLDFGDAGYGVLADGVKVIPSDALVSGDEYTFVSDQEILPGDVLLLNGEPIKVSEVLVGGGGGGGGHTRIRRDKKINVQEAYKTVNVDGYVDLGDAYYNGSAATLHEMGNHEASVEMLKIKEDFEISKFLTVTPEIGGTARMRLIYDEVKLGKNYFETEFYVELGGKVDVFLGAAYNGGKTTELIDLPMPIGLTGLMFDLELNLPIKVDTKVGGTATYNFSVKKGVAYTPDMGKQEISSEPEPTADFKLAGEFTASIGLSVSGGIAFLDDCLRLALNGEVGLQARGEWAPVNTSNPMNEAKSSFHACQQCAEIVASVYCEFYVNLTSRINETGEDKEVLPRFTLMRAEIPALEFYGSAKNEALSVHGGQIAFGVGDCPNHKYRATVYTVDEYMEDIHGVPVTVTRIGMEAVSGDSTFQYYLYPGEYLASGNFDGYIVTNSFAIDHRPGGTTLNAPAYSLSGYVSDAYTKAPISGASVSIALPENKTITVTTDAEGFYNFRNLKGGDCSVHFSAAGYQDRHVENLNYKPDTVNQLNVEMLGPMPILKASFAGPGTRQLLPEDGILTDGIPEITITNKTNRWGSNYIGDVVLKYEGYEDFLFENNGSCGGTSATCLDMGDGKYTIILSCWINGTMGGSESAVIQVRNGKLTVLKEMSLSDNTDGIYAEGKFSSDTKFSGTVYPSKIKFTAKANPTTWATNNRTGKKIYGRSSGIMNYQKNDEGYYDLVHSISYICGSYNYDHVGTCYTLYKMKNGTLSMEKQWFEGVAD